MALDPRFLAGNGREVFTGNELLVKGCLEVDGGVHLMTGYPGSPVAGFFDILGDINKLIQDNGIRAFQANNEALGAAAANGSQMLPCRAVVTMKSVGLHVAADALALGTLAGANPEGGVVIITGDDPWCDSTQVPADSRFLYEHLRIPVIEPGTPQELKDWINLAFKLSRSAGLYMGYIVTTAHADGGGTVMTHPNQFPTINTKQRLALETVTIPVERTVLLPPRTWQKELGVADRFAVTLQTAREVGVNRTYPVAHSRLAPGKSPLGFITTGMGKPYLDHVLADIGLLGQFPVLNLGMSYPVDVALVREFSETCKHMIVIEERRSFLEKNIRDGLFRAFPAEAAEIGARLFGKSFPAPQQLNPQSSATAALNGIPDTRGLNASVLAQILIPLIKATEDIPAELRNGKLSAVMEVMRRVSRPRLEILSKANDPIVPRTPTFCPGCPHRDSSATLLEIRKNFADPKYMMNEHGMAPVDLVAHGDTGCYTMLMFAPTEQLMHNYSGMGLGGGTGSGIDPFITNKQIVFMGDGTFFHSGQIAISNSIKNGQDLTYIILENGTTAMTGHQEHPGTEEDVLGNRTWLQDIESICRAMAGTSPLTVTKLSPADRSQYKSVLEKTILSDGVKVIIADKECGITYHREKSREERKTIKEKGYLPKKTHMNVTPEVCENCLECTKQTACPGLTTIDTDYGRKIDTDLTWCVNDGACERVAVSNEYGNAVKPCPSFEQVTVVRERRRRYTLPHMGLDKLPDPARLHEMNVAGDSWRVHMSGVGGMGIGIVTSILVRAGHKEGYRVIFQDKKGLAIRNGGVFAQITYVRDDAPIKPEADGAGEAPGVATNTPDPLYPVTGMIPYGKADLLLGIDILEAARATDPRENFRVATRERTCAVLNLHKQPTVYTLLGKQDFEPEKLRDLIFEQCREEHSYAKNLAMLCEERLGSKQYSNIMMLGVAYQLGLLPVSNHSMAWAIKDTIRRDHRKNIKAFNIGRKLALEPRALPNKPIPETWEQLVVNKGRILRKTRLRGRTWSAHLDQLVHWAMKPMRDLPDDAKYDLAMRIYDLLQYQDQAFAKRYVELVRGVYKRDSAENGFAATIAAIWNLAKVMLIKDEPYVAYLLTRYEKKQRDIAKYGVDISNGDKLVYRHHTSPEFNIAGRRVRFKITTSDWHLNIVRRMKWWRKLPGWHRREVDFRDWYIGLLDRVNLSTAAGYEQALRVLRSPEPVTGYREVRYPKMNGAREAIEAELSRVPTAAEPEQSSLLDSLRNPTRV
jgi:indolepyruvate ferredoxin oxidoreductase